MIEGRKVGPRSGYVKATFSLTPSQLQMLLTEAKGRAERAGRFRPDASELVREVLDAWIGRRDRREA